jgi:Uncharacterized protein conserved in bacteria
MKQTHTILVPQMLPVHFDLLRKVMRKWGYRLEVLKTDHKGIAEEGLKNVHNDTCYPALLVIGQFIDALKSGEYDLDKTALMLTQTGGGCRASNYIALLRKALDKNGFGHIPIISLNFSGLEKSSGFALTLPMLLKVVYALLYGDFLMCIYNQCIPYERTAGDTASMLDRWTDRLAEQLEESVFPKLQKTYRAILNDFAALPMDRSAPKIKVGIVGEIYLKYAPLGNNHLEDYLVKEGMEVVNSGLLDFILYCIQNGIFDKELYDMGGNGYYAYRIARHYVARKQHQMIAVIKQHGVFTPPADFTKVVDMAKDYLGHGVKMGEGWLLTAEMLELIHSGVSNIISAQPFGCLPNHIVAKGMMRKIKDNYPEANIVAIDYDPGASVINQENRIKLMLANARLKQQGGESAARQQPAGPPVDLSEEILQTPKIGNYTVPAAKV